MNLSNLPKRVDQIRVGVDGTELGLLTRASVHYYQPTQTSLHVSLTMTRPGLGGYSSGTLHPIFAQNLPEGFNRRFISERLARYAKVDDMYLLALQANNGVGMLCYQSELNLPEPSRVSLDEILTYQGQAPLFPQLLEKYYLRNLLSGVQPKVSILHTEKTVQQKDLIVKSFDEEFPLLTVNEFVCMQAAAHCGLKPPNTFLSDNLETFVVERFDKPNGRLLGYEDFSTLMKRPNSPDAKYLGSYEALLEATYRYTGSIQEVRRMYHYVVFNCLIGNGDAHLKNFALQYTPDMQRIFVSPPFDMTHTLIYDTIDNKMALKIKGSKQFPGKADLVNLASSKSFTIEQAECLIDATAEGILQFLDKSSEISLFGGLKASIHQAVSQVMASASTTASYRHDKKRKYE